MADDIDEFEFVTVIRKREEEPLKINGVVYSIIELVATSVYNFIYLYTPTREMLSVRNKTSSFDIFIGFKFLIASTQKSWILYRLTVESGDLILLLNEQTQ